MADKKADSLYERTRQLLMTSDKTYLQIFSDTGIPPHWLTMFSSGNTPDPSVNRVQKLYEYLTDKPLQLS